MNNQPNKHAVLIGNKNGKQIWQDNTTLKNIKTIIVTNNQGQIVDSIDLHKSAEVPARFIPER